MAREFATVGVVGLGTMGAGIVEVLARHGLAVLACERHQEGLDRGRGRVESSTARAVSRGRLTQDDRRALLDRVRFTHELSDLAECDLVVEAVPERLDLKREVFAALDTVAKPDAVLATNTSSLSVTAIGAATSDPRRVVGLHFFNPAPVLRLVEVVRTVVTDDDVVEDVTALVERIGKKPVVVGDRAGFIANALLFGYLNHAVSMYGSRYATREDIDAAMTLGCRLPMGPLALMDLIGLDTAHDVLDTMYEHSRDRLHAPSPVLRQMVAAGLTGRKGGRGFYTYAEPGSSTVVPDAATPSSEPGPRAEVRPVSSVGVVGSGTMATGIVEVLVATGHDVVVVARSADKADAVLASVGRSLDKAVRRGRLERSDADASLGRLRATTSLDDLAQVDLVVEAVVEDLGVKRAVFAELDRVCRPGAVLATTTSSLPVVGCAAATSRPGDVVGMHFFNPAPVMQLVEVVATVTTADDVVATAVDLCHRLGKHPVTCTDRAGFIVNALLFPYLNDAVKMVEARYASADDVDTAMKSGCGYPMGPFELLDVVGLDVSLAIERELYRASREQGHAPAPLLEHLVTAGHLGRKSGRGFRQHA